MIASLLWIVLKLNLAAAAAMLAVLVLRQPVRRLAGARVAYALWLAVPLAMCAVLLPAPVAPTESAPAAAGLVGIAAAPAALAPAPMPDITPMAEAPAWVATAVPWPALALGIWFVGLGLFAGVQMGRQARFVRDLGALRPDRIHGQTLLLAEGLAAGPAVVGAIAPRIVLPLDFAERFTPEEQAIILAHEQAHLRGGDARINVLATGIQALCWFNPLAHVAGRRMRIDQELACDAAVIAARPGERRRYGELMLRLQLASQPLPVGCQWQGAGTVALKERLVLLAAQRPGPGRRLAGLALVAIAGLGIAAGAWSVQPARAAETTMSSRDLNVGLFNAIRDGDLAGVSHLIAAGADVNARLVGDGTPLIEAARVGRGDIVALLLARGADPNLALRREGNPLIRAAAHGHLDVVRQLVEAGAEVNAFVINDETPLINAARSGRLEVVAYLIEQGADPNLQVQAGSNPVQSGQVRSPLSEARRFGRGDIVAYLIGRGAVR